MTKCDKYLSRFAFILLVLCVGFLAGYLTKVFMGNYERMK